MLAAAPGPVAALGTNKWLYNCQTVIVALVRRLKGVSEAKYAALNQLSCPLSDRMTVTVQREDRCRYEPEEWRARTSATEEIPVATSDARRRSRCRRVSRSTGGEISVAGDRHVDPNVGQRVWAGECAGTNHGIADRDDLEGRPFNTSGRGLRQLAGSCSRTPSADFRAGR